MPKKYFKVFIFLFYIISCNVLYAHNSTIDSLENELKIAAGEKRINVLNNLCNEYRNFDTEKAIAFLEEAIRLAEETNNTRELSSSYNYWGLIHANKSNYEEALGFYFKSFELKKQLDDPESMAKIYCNIGNVYGEQGDNSKCLDFYLKGQRIFDSLGKEQAAASISVNIGAIYYVLKNYNEALSYFEKAYSVLKDNTDKHSATIALSNIGAIYFNQGNYNKALEIFNTSLQINIESKYQRGVGLSYEQIAGIYERLDNIDEAITYTNKALEIYILIDAKYDIATSFSGLGLLYSRKGEYALALEYLYKSLKIAEELNSLSLKSKSFKVLSEIYFKKGSFKEAYDYHLRHISVKDSLFNEESSKQIAEMQTKYDSEKKEKEIKLLTKEKEVQNLALNKNRMLLYSFLGGFALVLVLALIVINGYRHKRKANKALEAQNKEIVDQKNIIEEKNKDITGSINYAKRIQEAILPSENNILSQNIPDSFTFFKPKDIVSGDFYWVNQTKDGILLFAAVDCTGHGVPGAFMSIVGNNLLNQAVNEQLLTQPAEILNFLIRGVNKTLRQTNEENSVRDGMDIALCMLQKQEGDESYILQYAGAYNPLLLIRKKQNLEMEEIKGDKHPIGAFTEEEQYTFTNHELQLQKGDSIYIFSDGFADQFGGPKGKKFKCAQLKQLFLANADKSMFEQKEVLEKAFEEWKGDLGQVDDVCIIGVRVG